VSCGFFCHGVRDREEDKAYDTDRSTPDR
jgi:hypothetical protein